METLYDAIIVGGGPAGLSAAIYLARAQFRVLVLEKEKIGGQITITNEVVNYPGVLRTDGAELTETMRRQAEGFGAECKIAEVLSLDLEGDYKVAHTDRGDFRALGIVYAAGAHPRLAGFAGEADYRGRGVAYCATCDGEFFTGKDIYVIGGGFAAVEEGLFLTRYGRKVVMLVRGDDFTIHAPVVDEIKHHPKVEIRYHSEVVKVDGDSIVRSITVRDRQTGEETVLSADGDNIGIFVFVGYAPENKLVQGKVELNPQGYIITDVDQKTNIDGVYAAGDICVKDLRQVVTAVADGATAATALEKYLGSQYRKLGLTRTFAKKEAPKAAEKPTAPKAAEGAFLDNSIREALAPVLARFERPILLRLYDDGSRASAENRKLLNELDSMSDKISVDFVPSVGAEDRHTISICSAEGEDLGLRFHGVPGGHEFNSFVLAMYNAAGPGQDVGEENNRRIASIDHPVRMQIAVSLSCTMCPELVAAAERIAAANDKVTVDVYDFQYYPDMKKKYNIMSVPCLIVNEKDVHFGKKSITQLLTLLGA